MDANLLLALAWENHIHHVAANAWLAHLEAEDRWVTCPITQCGFVRISSNPRFLPEALPPALAASLLEKMTMHAQHVFWPDSVDLRTSPLPMASIRGHQQVTDAYLLALCLQQGGRLVTFDDGIPSLAQNDAERAAIVLLQP